MNSIPDPTFLSLRITDSDPALRLFVFICYHKGGGVFINHYWRGAIQFCIFFFFSFPPSFIFNSGIYGLENSFLRGNFALFAPRGGGGATFHIAGYKYNLI